MFCGIIKDCGYFECRYLKCRGISYILLLDVSIEDRMDRHRGYGFQHV